MKDGRPDDEGTVRVALPEGMNVPSGSWLTGAVRRRYQDDEGNLFTNTPNRRALLDRIRSHAERMPRKSEERRDAMLVVTFYEEVSDQLRIEGDEMIGSLVDIQDALRWYRDKGKHELTPEQEQILKERPNVKGGIRSLPVSEED
jgi:hypothetical protein